ncbi:MAG: hypothetical protein ACFFG0_11480 [Candidatus Thorarchaeota archaeon]
MEKMYLWRERKRPYKDFTYTVEAFDQDNVPKKKNRMKGATFECLGEISARKVGVLKGYGIPLSILGEVCDNYPS